MAFAANRTVNLLNLHYALKIIGFTTAGAFTVPYLIKGGMSAPAVLLFMVGILMGRFALRPLVVRLALRFGLRRLLIAGSVLNVVQYLLVGFIDGISPALFALVGLAALGDMLYWTCYHAYFARMADEAHRGQQIGMREATSALVGTLSPVFMALLLTTTSPLVSFATAAVAATLAILPLFATPDVDVPAHIVGPTANPLSVRAFACEGWISAGAHIVWGVALFDLLDQSYTAFGGTLALAALAGAAGSLSLGRFIDTGGGVQAVPLALAAMASMILLRAMASYWPDLAFAAHAIGAFVACLYAPTLMTAVYGDAKRSPCTLRFHVATEGGWDFGASSLMLITAAAVAWGGLPLSTGVLLGLAALLPLSMLLRRLYERSSAKEKPLHG